jgi:Fe2+ transport system protein FeoA
MVLTELKTGNSATILKIHAENSLRNRLNSLGIIKGEVVEMKRYSMAKQTIEIEVNHTLIALRREEATKIEIEAI